jgi:predicted nuclease of predicted toxin-antitoxin system
MKFLFDENLSDRLTAKVAGLFPGSIHVKQTGLIHQDDTAVWAFAKVNGYIIISKDWDFHQMSLLHGFPPKVIYLDLGNCPTRDILRLLEGGFAEIKAFAENPIESILILGK